MTMPSRAVRVVQRHDQALEYHEWITLGERVRADRLGRGNPRMWSPNWTKWICNNVDCSAFAFVSDQGIRELLEAAE